MLPKASNWSTLLLRALIFICSGLDSVFIAGRKETQKTKNKKNQGSSLFAAGCGRFRIQTLRREKGKSSESSAGASGFSTRPPEARDHRRACTLTATLTLLLGQSTASQLSHDSAATYKSMLFFSNVRSRKHIFVHKCRE